MRLDFGRLANRGIVQCVSVSLRELSGIEVLFRSPGPTRVLMEGGGYFRPIWRDYGDGLFHGLSDCFVLFQCV